MCVLEQQFDCTGRGRRRGTLAAGSARVALDLLGSAYPEPPILGQQPVPARITALSHRQRPRGSGPADDAPAVGPYGLSGGNDLGDRQDGRLPRSAALIRSARTRIENDSSNRMDRDSARVLSAGLWNKRRNVLRGV